MHDCAGASFRFAGAMTTFRKGFPVLLALIVSIAFTACQKRESAVTEANRTQTLLLGNLSEPNDLDPAYPDSQQTANIVIALMEGLCQYDAKTSLPVPAVAESWEASNDSLTWTFHLRPTARWSNGEPLTAKDFVYSYRRNLSPGLGAEYTTMLFATPPPKSRPPISALRPPIITSPTRPQSRPFVNIKANTATNTPTITLPSRFTGESWS